MKERLLYIDMLKAFGIILVVMGHVFNDTDSIVSHFIYAFHMPLFFLLSGVFFDYDKKINFSSMLKKRWKSMLKPYLFFYIITFLYWVIIERNMRVSAGGVDTEWFIPILGLLWQGMDGNMYAHNNPLWFIPCLMSVNVIAFVCSNLDKKYRYIAVGVSLVLYCLLCYSKIHLPWELNIALLAFGFFYCGKLVKMCMGGKKAILLALFGVDLFLFSLIPANTHYLSMLGLSICDIPIYYLRAIVTIYIFIIVAKWLEQYVIRVKIMIRAVEYIGANTLVVMCVHDPVKRVVLFVVSKCTSVSIDIIRGDILWSLSITLIIVLILLPIIFTYNRYVQPRLL